MTERDWEGDVVEQADALMRRYRSFVARSPEESALQEAPSAPSVDVEDDLPVLTDIVSVDAIPPADVPVLLDALRTDLELALADWLAEALPAAVANASQQILAELEAKARHSLLPRLHETLEARRPQQDR